jgi:hypothetical protein
MNKGRRIGAIVATTAAAIGMTMTMTTAPASAATKVKGPQPVNQLLSSVDSGKPEWQNVFFKTDKKVCDFKLMVWGNSRVDIGYPGELPKPYTSLYGDSKLRKNEVDYAAFKVTADYDKDRWVILTATITYNYCGKKAPTLAKNTGFLMRVNA